MRTSDPDIWAAGDVVETPHTVLPGLHLAPLAGPANRQARVAAENICGRDTEYQSTQGTSIVKVFDMVAGGTGATERQLTRVRDPVPGGARAPVRPRRLLPGHRDDAPQAPVRPDRPGAILGAPGHRLRRRRQAPGRPGDGDPRRARRCTTWRSYELAYAPAVRLGEGPDQHGRLRRLQRPARRPAALVRPGLPGQHRGCADHRRAHSRGVRDLAPPRRRERAARDAADGLRRLGHARCRCACTAPSASAATSPTGRWCSAASPTSPPCPAAPRPSGCGTTWTPTTTPPHRWRTTPSGSR